MTVVAVDDTYKPEEDNQPVLLTQAGHDLNLSQESAQLLSSCLKEKLLLAPGTMFYWYQDWEKEDSFLHSRISNYWFIATTLLDWLNQWALTIILWNGDILMIQPAEVSQKFFYVMEIVFHLSLLSIYYKWKKLSTAWIIYCHLLNTRSANS